MTLKAVLGLDSSQFDNGLNAASGKMSSFGGALKSGFGTVAKIGAAALGAATTAVTGFAAASVKTGMTFDSSMSQVAATLGLSMSEMENAVGSVETSFGTFEGNLRDFAQFMGQNTAFSASQAADALNYMALAGYNAQQSMDMLPNVLNLAAAGSMDLAQASDMITDSQSALGLTFEQTNTLVDQMAKTASRSNTSVAQLGEAILTVGGTAKNLVGGTTELNTALGILADNGMKGAEGGTKLRNMIQALTAPTDKASALMEELGVSAFDADGNMRPLNDTFADLADAMSNMTQQGRMETMAEIFNARDIKAAEAMLANYGKRWDELTGEIDNAKGAADEMAKTQLDNLAGDVTLLKSAFEGAQIAVSDSLTPSLREFVQFGTKGLSELTTAFQEGGISGAMDKLGEILADGITMVTDMLPDMIDAGLRLLGALGEGIVQNAPQIFSAIETVGGMIKDALVNVMQDAAAKMSEVDWASVGAKIGEKLKSALSAAKDIATVGIKLISELAKGIGEAAPTLIPAAVEAVAEFAQGIVDSAPSLIEAAFQLISGLAEGIINAIPVLIQALPQLIVGLVEGLISFKTNLMQTAIELFTSIVEAIPEIITQLTAALPQIIDGIVNALISGTPQMVQAYVQLFLALVEAAPQISVALIAAIPQIIEALAQGIMDGLNSIVEAVAPVAMEFVNVAIQTGQQVIASVQAWLAELPGNIAYGIGLAVGQFAATIIQLPQKAQETWESIKQGVSDFATQFVEQASMMARNFFNALVNTIQQLPSRLRALGQQLVGAIKDLPSKFMQVGRDIVEGLWQGISGGWSWLTSQVKSLADSLLQGVKDGLQINSPSKVFANEVGKWIPAGIALGIEQNSGVVTKALDNLITMPDLTAYARQSETADSLSTGNFVQNLTINSPRELDPSETARLNRNASREMMLQLRMA